MLLVQDTCVTAAACIISQMILAYMPKIFIGFLKKAWPDHLSYDLR